MFIPGGQPSPDELITVGDFDPQVDDGIEYDFIGRVIAGRYTVLAPIGGGGMADVFRATDEELGVDVAIKLLKPRMASDELRARMVQEARAAAQVRHPNLVRVFGTGKLDSTAFIVMELLDGPNLEQYLCEHSDQRLPWQEALTLLLPALEALHAIHERGYVHRDIKAGNILVTREAGRAPSAIVIDLGLVKQDRSLRNAASPPTTGMGVMLCTPGYTSPEQAAGRPVDRRSDIYSMGVTIYRVLAGRLPFHDARGRSATEVLARHIHNEPTALADAASTANIPREIAAVVEAALRKDPGERPQTMLAFAEALRTAARRAAGSTTADRKTRNPYPFALIGILGAAVAWSAKPAPTCPAGDIGRPTAAHVDHEHREPRVASGAVIPASPDPSPPAEAPPADETSPVPPAPVVTPPAAPPPTSARTTTTQTTRRRQILRDRTADVQRCADQAMGTIDELSVRIDMDEGGIVRTEIVGAPPSPVSFCIDHVVRQARLPAPPAPISFVQVFRLRTKTQQ